MLNNSEIVSSSSSDEDIKRVTVRVKKKQYEFKRTTILHYLSARHLELPLHYQGSLFFSNFTTVISSIIFFSIGMIIVFIKLSNYGQIKSTIIEQENIKVADFNRS
jgi:hypothetical protein